MAKQTVRDRWGNEIYLTDERWEHILERHEELTGLFQRGAGHSPIWKS